MPTRSALEVLRQRPRYKVTDDTGALSKLLYCIPPAFANRILQLTNDAVCKDMLKGKTLSAKLMDLHDFDALVEELMSQSSVNDAAGRPQKVGCAMSPERSRFLHKYLRVYDRCFSEDELAIDSFKDTLQPLNVAFKAFRTMHTYCALDDHHFPCSSDLLAKELLVSYNPQKNGGAFGVDFDVLACSLFGFTLHLDTRGRAEPIRDAVSRALRCDIRPAHVTLDRGYAYLPAVTAVLQDEVHFTATVPRGSRYPFTYDQAEKVHAALRKNVAVH